MLNWTDYLHKNGIGVKWYAIKPNKPNQSVTIASNNLLEESKRWSG